MILTNSQIRIKLFESLKDSFFRKTAIITFGLLFVLLITAFILVATRFYYKLELNQQKDLIIKEVGLNEQWSQIVLEYSSLATPIAVEIFTGREKMSLPAGNNFKFLNKSTNNKNESK